MSEIVLQTLKRELARKQKRIDKLEVLMTERHINPETAKLMDSFRVKFNEAETVAKKLRIINQWGPVTDRWDKQVENARKQDDNYLTWMNEQDKLISEVHELESEIFSLEFRESMRKVRV